MGDAGFGQGDNQHRVTRSHRVAAAGRGIGFHSVTLGVPLTNSRGSQRASKLQRRQQRQQGAEFRPQRQQQQQEEPWHCCPQVSVRLTHKVSPAAFSLRDSPNHRDTEPESSRAGEPRPSGRVGAKEKLEVQTCTEAPEALWPAHFLHLIPLVPPLVGIQVEDNPSRTDP